MKKLSIIFVSLVMITSILSGCGKKEVEKTKIFENEVYVEYEMICSYEGKDIYGIACVPISADEKFSTVIFSHGFSGKLENNEKNAHALAEKGIASYRFEFYGGSKDLKSGGETTEMSIFTEKRDLEEVMNMVKNLDFVDAENLFLYGMSQGGLVSAIVANDHADEIKGLILLYPAFVIPDSAREMFSSVDEIPDTLEVMGTLLGKTYYEDLLNYDSYENINNFKKDVLIFHGDADQVVDISYSEKALEVYNSAELVVLEGSGHGNLSEDASKKIVDMTYEYIVNH